MNPLQIIFDFFKEIFNRIKTKSPFFFKVLMVIMASLTFAGYFPSMLQRWFGVEVPGNVITIFEDVAKYTAGFLVACGLTAKSSIVGQTENGAEVRLTNENKMPFTAKAEKKDIAKAIPPPEVIENVPEIEVKE